MASLDLKILWEDGNIMVVNKPPFVVVNRAESIKEETVADWAYDRLQISEFRDQVRDKEIKIFVERCGVAHRLDKETSGCLLIAKNPLALKNLLLQFKERKIKKEYLALVHGHLAPREGTIRLPLARSRFDREKWEVKYSGKIAQTLWRVEKYYTDTSLVRLFPKTGRTHQIRVHLSHLGFPIFADEKYLTKRLIKGDRELLAHHFLHAEKIGFWDMSDTFREVSAPLPSDCSKLLLWIEDEQPVFSF